MRKRSICSILKMQLDIASLKPRICAICKRDLVEIASPNDCVYCILYQTMRFCPGKRLSIRALYCIISVLSLDVLRHNRFIVQVLRKRLITMLCYVFVVGQGLSVQRTLLHTCFPHIAIKLSQHGLAKYNTCFYTMFILMVEMHFSSLCFSLIPILVPTFYFYHIYSLFGKTTSILVLSVSAGKILGGRRNY